MYVGSIKVEKKLKLRVYGNNNYGFMQKNLLSGSFRAMFWLIVVCDFNIETIRFLTGGRITSEPAVLYYNYIILSFLTLHLLHIFYTMQDQDRIMIAVIIVHIKSSKKVVNFLAIINKGRVYK